MLVILCPTLLSCGSSVARQIDCEGCDAVENFQYPILRIVGCKHLDLGSGDEQRRLSVSYPADRRLQGGLQRPALAQRQPFSILSCGSSVARLAWHKIRGFGRPSFSILSCGSSVASVPCGPAAQRRAGLSVSYPADRRLQVVSSKPISRNQAVLSVSYPADRRLQGRRG